MQSISRLLAGAAFTCSACSLVVSVDGLSGGAPSGPTPDASLADGPPSPFDSGTVDAAPEDAGGARFCESQPTNLIFCDDFEEAGLPAPWEFAKFGAIALRRTTDNPHGGAGALLAESPTLEGTEQSVGLLRRKLAASLGRETIVDFWVRPEVYGDLPGGGWAVARLDTSNSTGGECKVFFRPFKSSTQLLEACDLTDGGTNYAALDDLPALPVDQWSHVVIRLSLAGGAKYYLTINEVEVGTFTGRFGAFTSAPTLYMGITFLAAPTKPWRMRFDDVSVRLEP